MILHDRNHTFDFPLTVSAWNGIPCLTGEP